MTDFGVVTIPCVAFVTRMTGAAAGVKGGCARARGTVRGGGAGAFVLKIGAGCFMKRC